MQKNIKNEELLNRIRISYPKINFKPSQRFLFHPPNTVAYNLTDDNFPILILHELGHALIGINSFETDIERIKIEVSAWEKARELAQKFAVPFDDDFAENNLDSYRNWFHSKSICKKCGQTRYQTPDRQYHCPNCDPF